MTLRAEGLTVRYGRTLALDSVEIEIEPGISGLFGPNGSGKSTFLRVVAGLLRPSGGRITLNGRLVSNRDEGFRRLIGYSGHTPGLYERLTVRENLDLFSSMYGCGPDRAPKLIEDLALEDRAERRVGELSAGSKRTASVARALLHEPQILLLDEPYTNAVEEAAEAISRAVVAWRRPGRTAIIATHGAKRVRAFADAAIILQRARLVRHRPEGMNPPAAKEPEEVS